MKTEAELRTFRDKLRMLIQAAPQYLGSPAPHEATFLADVLTWVIEDKADRKFEYAQRTAEGLMAMAAMVSKRKRGDSS